MALKAELLGDEAVGLVRGWLDRAQQLNKGGNASSRRLAEVLKDPKGPTFALGFVDRVARPEDLSVAARNFRELSLQTPDFLPLVLKTLVKLGGFFAPLLPRVVVPIARWALKILIGHLIIDASEKKLGRAIARLTQKGDQLNINLLGEAVLGEDEANRRLRGIKALIEREDVDYVSIKPSAIASQLSIWGYEQTVDRVVERLIPVYQQAAATNPATFINLDMEEFKDLDLTMDIFERVLSHKSLKNYSGGIVLQAYLPEAFAAMRRIQGFAAKRVKAGGAAVKVRLVKGANLQMEQVDAELHDWPLAVLPTKLATDTNYKRVLDWALTKEHCRNVRVGIAGHNLFDVAFGYLLAARNEVKAAVDFEMLIGMAPDQADAVRETVGKLILYTPVVNPKEFDAAVGYLVRRLDENASSENFMSAVFDLADNEELFAREKKRFLASLKNLRDKPAVVNRVQNRKVKNTKLNRKNTEFHNEADTDPSLAANREWFDQVRVLSRSARGKQLGNATLKKYQISDSLSPARGAAAVNRVVTRGQKAGASWGKRSAKARAAVLLKAAEELAAARAKLLAVMMQEAGKTLQEGDAEVSEAIDFARYYAQSAIEMSEMLGAKFKPVTFTLVTPPWNFPVAIAAGSVLAALASGSAVAIKPAPQVRRCGAVMVEALWAAGVPRDVLQLVDVKEGELGEKLISHPGVERLILTGAFETAELFKSWRADLPLLAETSGKNAVVVTPSADFDLAVADIVKSAFGHAGQKCSAASLVILVGSVAKSERFYRQLVDAVTTLRVGYPDDPAALMGPVIEPPGVKLKSGLSDLAAGEKWLVKPELLDKKGRLWSPGIKAGVKPGSVFHQTEYFGPVLGIMKARDLAQAIVFQNAVDYGLTAGIFSLDPKEVLQWLAQVQAGNCYINRSITGAIVQRQPFGGWKKSSVGAGAKAGGANYLMGLGTWSNSPSNEQISKNTIDDFLLQFVNHPALAKDSSFLLRALASDQVASIKTYALAQDKSNLSVERNVFRYLPCEVTVRAVAGVSLAQLIRVLLAGLKVGAKINLSLEEPLAEEVLELLKATPKGYGVLVKTQVESDFEFALRVRTNPINRIRVLGSSAERLAIALNGAVSVAIYADRVTESGRVEMLPFVLEQAISLTTHRFGAIDARFEKLLI